jgi:hypothetical protein
MRGREKSMKRRLRRMAIDFDVLLSKWELIAFLRKLPDDAEIIRMGEDFSAGASYIVIYSESFDEIQPGQAIPYYDVWVSHAELEAERTQAENVARFESPYPTIRPDHLSQGGFILICTCDLKYTGARTHRSDCPMRKKG